MPRPRRSSCGRRRVSPLDYVASSGRASAQALRGRTPDGVRSDGGPAPPDLARPADLLRRRDLVGRLRDRGRHGRSGRSLARCVALDAADRDRRLDPHGDRRRLLPADRAGLRPVGRRVHRGEGEPRQGSVPRRGSSTARGLRPHRRGLGGRRHLRDHLGRLIARAVPRRAVPRCDRADRARQPPRRQGGRVPLRDPDLRVHHRPVHRDRNGHCALHGRDLPARSRPRIRSPPAWVPSECSSCCGPSHRAHRR